MQSTPWLALSALPLIVCGGCGENPSGNESNNPPPRATASAGSTARSDSRRRDDGPIENADATMPAPAERDRSGRAVLRIDEGAEIPFPEAICETTRGVDGQVIGWAGHFGDPNKTRSTDDLTHVFIAAIKSGYEGDGEYDSQQLEVQLAIDSEYGGGGIAGAAGTLTLTDGGKAGSYRWSSDIEPRVEYAVDFRCDAGDDAEPKSGAPIPTPPPPGTAFVQRLDGSVMAFTGVKCVGTRSKDGISYQFDLNGMSASGKLSHMSGRLDNASGPAEHQGSDSYLRTRYFLLARGALKLRMLRDHPLTASVLWGDEQVGMITCPLDVRVF